MLPRDDFVEDDFDEALLLVQISLNLNKSIAAVNKKWIWSQFMNISPRFTDLLNILRIFSLFFFLYSLIFVLKLHEPLRNNKKEFFFNSSDLGIESKTFFLQYLIDILPLGSGSRKPKVADPTNPYPMH